MNFEKSENSINCQTDTEAQVMLSVLETIGSPAIISDIESSEIKFLNKSAKETFSIECTKLLRISDLYVNDKDYSNAIKQVKKGKDACIETQMHALDGGKIHVEGSAKPLIHKGTNYKLTVLKDVTKEKEFKYLATIDSLTGVNNRFSTMKKADRELKRHQRYGHEMAILTLDIDHFKTINDTYGHKAGDLALQYFTKNIAKYLRNIDIFGRIGGEEFVILLPETQGKDALQVAERIRKTIERMCVIAPNSQKVFDFTVSIGVSTIDVADKSIDDAIDRADKALYQSKTKGRNKVTGISRRLQMAS